MKIISLLRWLDEGNKKVDRLAKETATNEQRKISLKHWTYEDILRFINITIETNAHNNGEEKKLN